MLLWVLLGIELFMVELEFVEDSLEVHFLYDDADAADDAGGVCDDVITCAEYHVSS